MTHGASFVANHDSSVWSKILLDVILAMLSHAVDKYTGVRLSVGKESLNQGPTFRDQKQKKQNFEEASVVKALQQNDSQWEETCKKLI